MDLGRELAFEISDRPLSRRGDVTACVGGVGASLGVGGRTVELLVTTGTDWGMVGCCWEGEGRVGELDALCFSTFLN